MTDCAKKNMIFLTAWFLCMGFVLLSDFSWIALGILAVLSGISLYRNVLRAEDKLAENITRNVRYYIIISTLFVELAYMINCGDGFGEVYRMPEIHEEDVSSAFAVLVCSALFSIIRGGVMGRFTIFGKVKGRLEGFLENIPFTRTLADYQFPIVFYSVIWSVLFRNPDLNLAYFLFALVYMMGDVVRRVYDERPASGGKAGKLCFGLFSLMMLLVVLMNARMGAQLRSFDFHTVGELFSRWSVFLFLFTVAAAVLICTVLIETSLREGYAYEKMFLITTLSVLPVIFVSARVCVGYRWALLICYFVYVLIAVTRVGPRASDKKRYYEVSAFLPVPIGSLAVIFLLLAAQYGKVLTAAVFLLSTGLLAWALNSLRRAAGEVRMRIIRRTKEVPVTVTCLVILWLYVNTLSRLWLLRQRDSAVLVISAVTVLFLALAWVVKRNPGVYEKNKLVTFGHLIFPVLYLGIALSVFAYGGSDIGITAADGRVQIEVEAEGKDNAVVEAGYCWFDDLKGAVNDLIDESGAEYTPLPSEKDIEVRKGLLKVVVEDQKGVRTVKRRWFSGQE